MKKKCEQSLRNLWDITEVLIFVLLEAQTERRNNMLLKIF